MNKRIFNSHKELLRKYKAGLVVAQSAIGGGWCFYDSLRQLVGTRGLSDQQEFAETRKLKAYIMEYIRLHKSEYQKMHKVIRSADQWMLVDVVEHFERDGVYADEPIMRAAANFLNRAIFRLDAETLYVDVFMPSGSRRPVDMQKAICLRLNKTVQHYEPIVMRAE